MAKQKQNKEVKELNAQVSEFLIEGISPLVMNKFSHKAVIIMKQKQEAGSTATNKKRDAKDFKALYEAAKHISPQGWCGIPAAAFRASLVRACKIAGFTMTDGKQTVFVLADGHDKDDATPLVKIIKGKPSYIEHTVRIQNTVDIRPRAMWDVGWQAKVKISYDADMFTEEDITNLLVRAGMQVGVLEGRPCSPKSSGMGWGMWKVLNLAS